MELSPFSSERIRYLRRFRAASRGHKTLAELKTSRIRIARELSEIQNVAVRSEAQTMFNRAMLAVEVVSQDTPNQFNETLGIGLTTLIDYLEANGG